MYLLNWVIENTFTLGVQESQIALLVAGTSILLST